MTDTQQPSDERARFEAWFAKRGVWPRLTYLEVWQAALAAQRPESTQAMADEQLTEMWQELNNAACRPSMDRTPVYLQFARAALASSAVEQTAGDTVDVRALEACRAIVAWCDKNPPAGEALWCVKLARDALLEAKP